MISAVVPVLDEERLLPTCLGTLLTRPGIDEVVVVDGGSRDGSREAAARFGGVRWIEASRGRARQLNAGARAARGDVFLFLHADCVPPPDAAERIEGALSDPRVVAGAFRTRHDPRGVPPLVRPFLPLADLRSRRTHLFYGDQAPFVRRSAFFQAGGFPDQPIFEDLELARRLARLGRIAILDAQVLVSARRFARRPLRSAILARLLPPLYAAGVDPHRLAALWAPVR